MDVAMQDFVAHPIDRVNWKEYDYVPEVGFKIAYTDDAILLKYTVKEKYIKANSLFPNEPVYKDSCVEFFISFDEQKYYNFEFNCIGTSLASYGTLDKETRSRLSTDRVETIQTESNIRCLRSGFSWELFVFIPITIFVETSIGSLRGVLAKGNFYKCGDDLPIPHFLSWNNIQYPSPNFHLPEFFGEIAFA